MKLSRSILICLLAAVLVISSCLLGSCDLFNRKPNDSEIPNEKSSYTVTFDKGNEDADGNPPEAKAYEEGSKITLPDCPFTLEGYIFKGWSDGTTVYSAGDKYTVPSKNSLLTATWEAIPIDSPTLSELDSKFYDASKWVYMTNNDGATLDGGDIPYTMADGSIKFHRANQAIEMGDLSNSKVSFMLKGTNDWSIWFNSSSKDNNNNSSYRLAYAYGGIRIALSSAPEQAAAIVSNDIYNKGEWNRFDVEFKTEDGVCTIKLYINGVRAELSSGDNTTPAISVENNLLTHTQPAMFSTGNYMVVKVWEAYNFVQIKPVAKAEEKDLPVIACIGASITEGAGASNFYTESYPAQLQNALGGLYNVINLGNSGKTVRTDLGDDVAWLAQGQWLATAALVPDIAILNIGTNDSKTTNSPATTYENFYSAYENLIANLLQVNPDMEIVICTVPYAYSSIWDINNDNIANIIAPVQRDIAEAKGYTLIDLYEYTQGKAHLFPDGVHPSTEGYEMIVQIIKKALLEGEDALTEEFINEIDRQYAEKLTNISASITVDGDKINLVVTGDTTLTEGSYLKLAVMPGNSGGSSVDAVISNGRFTATIDLTTIERADEWFNVRLYTSESNSQLILMEQTPEYVVDREFAAGETKIILKSWNSDYGATLSFVIADNVYLTVDSVVIKAIDGLPILEITGSSNAVGAMFYVGIDPSKAEVYNYLEELVLASDGSYTVRYDLTRLGASGSWYNVRIYLSQSIYRVISLDSLKDADGNPIENERSLNCGATTIKIQTWNDGGVRTLSFSVSLNETYILEGGKLSSSNMPISITEQDGCVYLNFDGAVTSPAAEGKTIELIFTTGDSSTDHTDTIDLSKVIYTASNVYTGDDVNSFSFKVNLTENVGTNNDWIRFAIKITVGDEVNYYFIKPLVDSNSGDWIACSSPITVDGIKYELAICWSSLFVQIKN